MGSVRLGVDIGGTFTDITVLQEDTGEITIAKVPSRHSDPAGALIAAVESGIALADVDAGSVSLLVHGSTLVTNAVLENNLPRTALLTTDGYRDVLEIGRHFRPDMYSLLQDKPLPVVPRERRLCVPERTSADGGILVEPYHGLTHLVFEALLEALQFAKVLVELALRILLGRLRLGFHVARPLRDRRGDLGDTVESGDRPEPQRHLLHV